MSMILEALRKSDRERARQASERLRDGPSPRRRGRGPAGLTFALAGLLLLGAGAATWLALGESPSRSAAGAEPEIMENVATAPAPSRRAVAAPVRDLDAELAPPPAVAPQATTATVMTTPVTTAPVPVVRIEELRAPPFATLPEAVRNALPALTVNAHAWTENPDTRFVLINLRRYGEGDRLQEGPVVRRILRDGVVLEFQGQLFSLPRS